MSIGFIILLELVIDIPCTCRASVCWIDVICVRSGCGCLWLKAWDTRWRYRCLVSRGDWSPFTQHLGQAKSGCSSLPLELWNLSKSRSVCERHCGFLLQGIIPSGPSQCVVDPSFPCLLSYSSNLNAWGYLEHGRCTVPWSITVCYWSILPSHACRPSLPMDGHDWSSLEDGRCTVPWPCWLRLETSSY